MPAGLRLATADGCFSFLGIVLNSHCNPMSFQKGRCHVFRCCRLLVLLSLLTWLAVGRVSRGDEGPFPRPAKEAIAKAEEKVRDVYKGDLAKANKPSEKAALATALMISAGGVGQDDASRLVLLTMARDLAVDANDASLAMKALTALVNRFQPDGPTDVKEQIERGNVPWKAAETAPAERRLQLQIKAAEWYLYAKPAATGVDETLIAKRLAELGETKPAAIEKPSPSEKSAPTAKIPTGWVRIVNRATGLAIGIKGGSLTPGTVADQAGLRYPIHNWQIEASKGRQSHGYYTIRNQKTGQYLVIEDRSMERGASACQMPAGRHLAIAWRFEDAGDGCWRIINKNSGQCLEASGGDKGAIIRQTPYRANTMIQQWRLEEVKSGE